MKLKSFVLLYITTFTVLISTIKCAGSDDEAVQWANNFYTKLIEPLRKAADLDGIESTFKNNEYHLSMPDGTAFCEMLGSGFEGLAEGLIKSTNRIAEYVRENRVDPAAEAPKSIGNEDGFFVDPCSVYTKEVAEGLGSMVELYEVEKFSDERVNLDHSIVSFVRPSLAKTPYVMNELKNAHGLKEIFK